MPTNQPDRLERIETILNLWSTIRAANWFASRSPRTIVGHEARLARQDTLVERLDSILERMIHREGRGEES